MPVSRSIATNRISQSEFQGLAYDVMREVFAIHNDFGRLFDEKVYKRELAARMSGTILEASVELCYRDFVKRLFADVIVSQSGLFEFKVAEAIHPRHRSQTIQYLLLFDLAHGKIVNMQTEQVQHEFVNCHRRLTELKRFRIDREHWKPRVAGSEVFAETLIEILRDWGTGLELSLVEEALVHCLGGEEKLSSFVPVFGSCGQLSQQRMLLAAPNVAFRLTAFPDREDVFEFHARRLIEHTSIEAILWANIQHRRVTLKTIQ
jgi:GxxExxY protein